MVAAMRQTYRASAVRDGRWWFVEVPGERGLFTQVRRLDQAVPRLREVIALMRDVPEDSFDVAIDPDLASTGPLRDLIEDAARARRQAARAQESASSTMRRAVSEIRAAGYTSRDTGALLGVSVQRVSQLDRKPPRE